MRIERLAHGIYARGDLDGLDLDLLEATTAAPAATLCLASALTHHGLIDEIPTHHHRDPHPPPPRAASRHPPPRHRTGTAMAHLRNRHLPPRPRHPRPRTRRDHRALRRPAQHHRRLPHRSPARPRHGPQRPADLARQRHGTLPAARPRRRFPPRPTAPDRRPAAAAVNSRHAYTALRRRARTTGRTTQQLLTLYALEGFLRRLVASPHADRFVLKGGMLLTALDLRRPTRALTGVARPSPPPDVRVRRAVRDGRHRIPVPAVSGRSLGGTPATTRPRRDHERGRRQGLGRDPRDRPAVMTAPRQRCQEGRRC